MPASVQQVTALVWPSSAHVLQCLKKKLRTLFTMQCLRLQCTWLLGRRSSQPEALRIRQNSELRCPEGDRLGESAKVCLSKFRCYGAAL